MISSSRLVGRSIVVVALLLCVGLLVACAGPGPYNPVAPTPVAVPTPAPAPAPPSGPPFTLQLVSSGSTAFTDTPWSAGLSVVSDASQVNPPRPSVVTVNCGNGAGVQRIDGFVGQVGISCLFSAPGTFTVTTAATAATGFTAGAATSVTATVRPVPPPPTPAPTPAPAAPRVTIATAAVRCTTTRAFWALSANANVPIDHYEWDFGDGDDDNTTLSEVGHEFGSDGFKTITLEAHPKDSGDTLSASTLVFVKFAASGTPTTCP